MVYENSLKKEYLNKGIEQGIEEGVENTAVNMLRKNMDINLISEVTKLDLEKIQKLKTRIELGAAQIAARPEEAAPLKMDFPLVPRFSHTSHRSPFQKKRQQAYTCWR